MDEVEIPVLDPTAFDDITGPQCAAEFAATLERARRRGGTMWHVNATAQGGGVAEILQSVLGYLTGADIGCRWMVIDGSEEFFELTKQLHHLLHGKPGDLGQLPDHAREIYERTLTENAHELRRRVGEDDVVVLHDPQTVGLAPAIAETGAAVIWTCHIGADEPNRRTSAAHRFLAPYVERTDRQVFSRAPHVWDGLVRGDVAIIPPCLDAFSPKNQHLDDVTSLAILRTAGILAGEPNARPEFLRQNGASAVVATSTQMIETIPVPADRSLVTQISRWDPLKDHAGVMAGFVHHVAPVSDAHLVLAGPDPSAVDDDPEGATVLHALREQWDALPDEARSRVHLALLPMDDVEANAAIVNALQRASTVVVQKSLAEGFGLTVAEALWKGRPVIGSRVGGIQDQIDDGRSGVLLDDPHDAPAFGRAVCRLLEDPDGARAMGEAGRRRVVADYLAPVFLERYLDLAERLRTATAA